MTSRIYLSAVPAELRETRAVVVYILRTLGYAVRHDDDRDSEDEDRRDSLQEQIAECHGLIQLVGHHYGPASPEFDPDFGQLSYPQYEAEFARRTGVQIGYLLLGPTFTNRQAGPQSPGQIGAQEAYRRRIETSPHPVRSVSSNETLEHALCTVCAAFEQDAAWTKGRSPGPSLAPAERLPDANDSEPAESKPRVLPVAPLSASSARPSEPLASLSEPRSERPVASVPPTFSRRTVSRGPRWLVAALVTLLCLGGVAWWFTHKTTIESSQSAEDPIVHAVKMLKLATAEEEAGFLAAFHELPIRICDTPLEFHRWEMSLPTDDESRRVVVYADLEKQHQLPAGTLQQCLPAFLGSLTGQPNLTPLDLATWHFLQRNYAEVEEVFAAARRSPLTDPTPADRAFATHRLVGCAQAQQCDFKQALGSFKIAAELIGSEREPAEKLEIESLLGWQHVALVEFDQAKPLLEKILERRESLLGKEHPATLVSRNNLAVVQSKKGQNLDAGENLRKAATLTKLLGEKHPDAITVDQNLASVVVGNDAGSALLIYGHVLSRRERVLGSEHPGTLLTKLGLASALDFRGDYKAADAMHQSAASALDRVLARDKTFLATCLERWGGRLSSREEYVKAEQHYRHAFEIRRKSLGAEHAETLAVMDYLADGLRKVGKYAESETLAGEYLAIKKRTRGPQHAETFWAMYRLAEAFAAAHKLAEAEELARAAWGKQRQMQGRDDPHALLMQAGLVKIMVEREDFDGAEPMAREVLTLQKQKEGESSPRTLTAMTDLAAIQASRLGFGEAEKLYKAAAAAEARILGPEHRITLKSLHGHGLALLQFPNRTFGQTVLQRVLEVRQRTLGKDHRDTLASRFDSTWVKPEKLSLSEFENLHQAILADRERALGKEDPDTLASVARLMKIKFDASHLVRAEEFARRLVEGRERTFGKDHPQTLRALDDLAEIYEAGAMLKDAEPLRRRIAASAERAWGAGTISTLYQFMQFAKILEANQRYGEAEGFYSKCSQGYRKIFEPEHGYTRLTELGRLRCRFRQGITPAASLRPLVRPIYDGLVAREGLDDNLTKVAADLLRELGDVP